MQITGGWVYDPEEGFAERTVCTDGEKIARSSGDAQNLDASGCYVLPLLIDLHIHGYAGADVGSAEPAELERMARALTPSGLKLETKSVPSVRRRVVNLRELNPEITVEAVAKALARRFQEEYGPAAVQEWDFEASPPPNLARYRSAQWNLGSCPAYGASMDVSTSAGIFQVRAKVVHGRITEAALSTDALEQVPVPLLEQALLDCPFLASEVAGRLEEALRPGGIPKEQE